MKYIDADLLRKEIERRITDNTFGAKLELIDILAWLDTLQQEHQEEPDKSMEEAVELENLALLWASKRKSDYPPVIDAEGCEHEQYDFTDLMESFIAGWKCRDDQMPMPEDTVLFNKGVAEGRRLEREDMLKDAYVESQIVEDGRIELEGDLLPCLNPIILLPYPQFKPGDKVRIVVLKEEE